MQRLLEYPWAGNIRELENVLERAVILATGAALAIGPDLLPLTLPSPPTDGGEGRVRGSPAPAARPQPGPEPVPPNHLLAVPQPSADQRQPTLEAVERDYILTVLQQTNWVITGPRGAAKLLDLHPSTLRNRMKKLGITRASHHLWSLAPPVATSASPATTAPRAARSPLQNGFRS